MTLSVTAKPTIFFSHSAQDSDLLNSLKQGFCARTGGSIDVFLSSDGSSIPFGHNWQKTIEEALARAKLMFVFLSPLSVNSKWIYFESGFAYAKTIRVVPVALEGVELDKQPPPLQLLNGFNLRSHEGLNNLLAIANEVFGHSHALSFQLNDYEELLSKAKMGPRRALGRHADLVESVVVNLCCPEPQVEDDWIDLYANTPDAGALVGKRDGRIECLGLRLSAMGRDVAFAIDRLAVDRVYPIVEALLQTSNVVGSACSVEVWFTSTVNEHDSPLRRSAALIGTDWAPSGNSYVKEGSPKSGDLIFEIRWYEAEYPGVEDSTWLQVRKSEGHPSLTDIKDVLDLCFGRALLVESSRTSTNT